MKSWPKAKLGQVGLGLNIAQNHLYSLKEVISGHYLPQFTWKVDQLKSVRALLRITRLAPMKSYLVIICLN